MTVTYASLGAIPTQHALGVDIELSLEIDEMLVFSSGEGYFCFVGSDNYISCNGEEINWDRNKIPVAISSMKVVTTILGGSIVGIAGQIPPLTI